MDPRSINNPKESAKRSLFPISIKSFYNNLKHYRISFTMFTAYDCFRRLSLCTIILQLAHCQAERIPDEVPVNRVGEIEQSIGFYQAIELVENSLLYRKQSQYQSIEVHQTKHFGKLLLLDGVIQLTERDADSYNEMMAHVPMFQHPNPKRVLVIGGGDGYVLKEVGVHVRRRSAKNASVSSHRRVETRY